MSSKVYRSGLTVVELLIAMALVGIVFTLVTAFFVQQTRTSSQVQARNEVEVKVRMAAELIAQDLQMAGSFIVVTNNQARYVDRLLSMCSPLADSTRHCIGADIDDSGNSILTMFYATSLRDGGAVGEGMDDGACRRVDYEVRNSVLRRSEVVCREDQGPSFQPLANNIVDLVVDFVCADDAGATVDDPTDCYGAGNYPQQANIAVTGRSDNVREDIELTVSLQTSMPNLRPVAITD